MDIKISKLGSLSVKDEIGYIDKYCPFAITKDDSFERCGYWCPLFFIEDGKLYLCHRKYDIFEVIDERKLT